jgi:hypothetical protein
VVHDGSPSKAINLKIKIVLIHQAPHNNNTINDDGQANTFKNKINKSLIVRSVGSLQQQKNHGQVATTWNSTPHNCNNNKMLMAITWPFKNRGGNFYLKCVCEVMKLHSYSYKKMITMEMIQQKRKLETQVKRGWVIRQAHAFVHSLAKKRVLNIIRVLHWLRSLKI